MSSMLTRGACGLSVDLALDEPAIIPGDWVATEAGSRYLVTSSRVTKSRRHAQIKRYALRCARLPKHEPIPDDVRVVYLTWYPRGRA